MDVFEVQEQAGPEKSSVVLGAGRGGPGTDTLSCLKAREGKIC